MTKTRTDKQRISKAFKNLREKPDELIQATANFGSEKDIRTNRWYRGKEVCLDTRVYDSRVFDRMVSNGLGDDDNLVDPVGNSSSSLYVVYTEDVDPQVVVDALVAEGLYVKDVGKMSLRVLSHKTPEYQNTRSDEGRKNGYYGTGIPKFENYRNIWTDDFYRAGWIIGAVDRLADEGCSVNVAETYRGLRETLGTYEAGRVVVPMLEALVLKSYEEE